VITEIFPYLKTRVGRRFLAVFLIVSLIPLTVMRWLAIQRSEAAIKEQTFVVLQAASDGAEGQLREFIENLKEHLILVAQDERIVKALSPPATAQGSGNLFETVSAILASRSPSDVQEAFVLNNLGRVLASPISQNIGKDLFSDEIFTRGKESFFAGDVSIDSTTGHATWVLAAPIKAPTTRTFLGVVAFRINASGLNALTSGRRVLSKGADTQSLRIGETGETYLVNRDGLMITESRYVSNAVLKVKVDTAPVRVALERGQEITADYKDYRGTQVSGKSVVLHDPQWVMVTEIDFRQAFAPVKRLRHELIAATVVLIFLAILFAWSCTWRVLKPIRLLSESDLALAEQDEARAFVDERGLPNDEIGQLVRMRNSRVKAVFDYQKLLEDRTAKLQEMINEIEHISYAIVHDMRAPLRAMQGFANLLENDSDDVTPAERKEFLRKISAASVRLDDLIRDVLTYNKAVLAQAAVHPVPLAPLLRGILETYPSFGPEKANIMIQGTLPVVIGNEALLTQCFSNILDNAVRFVPPGTKPLIRIWSEAALKDEEFCRICIEDNGIGIPQNAQKRIFRMFQRLGADQSRTGVGLAIVHKVVERMGGSVGVQSDLGNGSRFWIELQLAKSTNTDADTKRTPDAALALKQNIPEAAH
jgi:signal transduction histidine kinase